MPKKPADPKSLAEQAALERLPKLVDVYQLARAVQRHPDTIRRWGRNEGLPYHQPGGFKSKWLIDADEFRKWFRSRCIAHEPRKRTRDGQP